MEENEQAVIDWVNTFELKQPCTRLTELSDGNILAEMLCQICPTYFESDTLNKETAGNWALAAGNIRKLLRMLDGYFTTVLHKKLDTSHVDVNGIAKNSDPEDILNLLELVVGAAVMCEERASFIQKIFELNDLSQAVLKALVEQAMGRAEDLEGAEEGESETGPEGAGNDGDLNLLSSAMTEQEQLRVREMVRHLQAERARLLAEVAGLEQSNEGLRAQLAKTAQRAQQKDQERQAEEGSDRARVQALEALNQKLSSEVEEAKREVDLKTVECEGLRHELRGAQQRLEASRELQAKLEMETHQQADELDIARDKVAKLARAEQAVEKYQKRLEEMVELKKQNKELCERMDGYLDQIHSLESANKGLATLQRMVEQYKNKAVELETQLFEAQSSVQMRDQQVAQLKGDLDKAKEARRMAQDECASLKLQLEQQMELTAAAEEASGSPRKGSAGGLDDAYHTETMPELREKVKRLERELRMAQAAGTGGAEGASAAGASGGASEAAAAEVALIQSELDEVRQQKKRLEETLQLTKKQLGESQYELSKAQEAAAEAERNADSSAQLRETSQRLAESVNTVRLLQERLKEKESTINRVEQEKSKLEAYTKRSLGTFKDKYMAVLATLREEKEDLHQKMRAQMEKTERDQDTWRREERLISSAMFELGVRIMDQKIQAQMQHSSGGAGGGAGATPGGADQYLLSAVNSPFFGGAGAGSSFLGAQREALSRSTADAAARSTPLAAATAGPGTPAAAGDASTDEL